MNHEIIHKPSMTEKTLTLSQINCYTFVVPVSVQKKQFKKVIEDKIKGKVISVNSKITKVVKRRRGKSTMTRVKYMTVKLPKDKKIEGFEAAK